MTINCKGSTKPLTTPMSLRKSIEEIISKEIIDKCVHISIDSDIIRGGYMNLPHLGYEYLDY
jgi:hypothetical protein